MSKRASENQLSELHLALAAVLKDQLQFKDENGKANAAILNVARQFLKDNGIDGAAGEVKELAELAEEFPFDAEGIVVPIKARG